MQRYFLDIFLTASRHMYTHHNLFITLLLGSKAETMLVKQPCYIRIKMHKWSFFCVIYTFLGSIFKLYYIQNCVTTNSVIKRLWCMSFEKLQDSFLYASYLKMSKNSNQDSNHCLHLCSLVVLCCCLTSTVNS